MLQNSRHRPGPQFKHPKPPSPEQVPVTTDIAIEGDHYSDRRVLVEKYHEQQQTFESDRD